MANFLCKTKYLFCTTSAAILSVGVHFFLSILNAFPTRSNFPNFRWENLQKIFCSTDIQISPFFKNIGDEFPHLATMINVLVAIASFNDPANRGIGYS